MIGTRLGPYEVLAKLGEGGMGEVYRARDTKLNRDVALKVLPDLLAGDPDRLARFHREAQVLASLNHPNIAHLYGFEDAGAAHALVMELVEGPTLADRIAPAMSPDSRWMAYTTNESGTPQVVVQSVPDPLRAKYPVSIKGGSEPRWRRDGKELYYVAPGRTLMAVTIKGDSELEVGAPVALFETTMPFPSNDSSQAQRYYDVTADGQRFLINTPRATTNPSPITVVLNWTAGLKR